MKLNGGGSFDFKCDGCHVGGSQGVFDFTEAVVRCYRKNANNSCILFQGSYDTYGYISVKLQNTKEWLSIYPKQFKELYDDSTEKYKILGNEIFCYRCAGIPYPKRLRQELVADYVENGGEIHLEPYDYERVSEKMSYQGYKKYQEAEKDCGKPKTSTYVKNVLALTYKKSSRTSTGKSSSKKISRKSSRKSSKRNRTSNR